MVSSDWSASWIYEITEMCCTISSGVSEFHSHEKVDEYRYWPFYNMPWYALLDSNTEHDREWSISIPALSTFNQPWEFLFATCCLLPLAIIESKMYLVLSVPFFISIAISGLDKE